MEYAEIINRIIDAEQRAQAIVAEASEGESAISDDIKAELDERRLDYRKKIERRLNLVAEQEKQIASERALALEAEQKKRVAEINDSFEKNRDKWVDEMFTIVTGAKA